MEVLFMKKLPKGIRVIKAGIFSDLNNLQVYSILDKEYSDFFGFSKVEKRKKVEKLGIETASLFDPRNTIIEIIE